MGSTGHGNWQHSQTGNVNNETFGIVGAVNYKGKVPENSGLDKPGNNKITLKVPGQGKSNILFQFKMSTDAKLMTITAFKDGQPEIRTKVKVDAIRPSLDKVIRDGSRGEKAAATKLKQLMSESTKVNEGQLKGISDKLRHEKGVYK